MSDSRDARLDQLWLQCQQRLVSQVAHDLKGALNGASVNLEVVRTRSERPGVSAADLASYAESATDQMTAVIRMTTALLALARGTRGPVEVGTITKSLAALLEDSFRIAGTKLEVVVEGGLPGTTSASATVVRLAVGELLLASAALKSDVTIRLVAGSSTTLEGSAKGGIGMPETIAATLADAGVQVKTAGHGISMSFPAPA